MQVRSTQSSGVIPVVNLLLYGRSGIGKTCSLAYCPKPIILSAENGLLSLKSKAVPYIQIDDIEALRKAYTWLIKSDEGKQYQTICIDSISEVCDQAMTECKQRIGNDPAKLYPELRASVLPLLSAFKSMPRHFVAIAHETTKQSQHDHLTAPSVTGNKLSDDLPYVFDVVLHYTLDGDGNRVVYTNADTGSVAKDRTGLLSPEIPDIDERFLCKIINKLTGVNDG